MARASRIGGVRRVVSAATVAAACLTALVAGPVAPATAAAPPPGPSPIGTTTESGAVLWSEDWLSDREVDIVIWSPAVNNFVGNRVLLPKGWSRTETKKHPVLLMLHGGNDNFTSWTRETDIEGLSADRDVIVAMPDAGLPASYTNYWNQGKGGPPAWEDYHLEEFLKIVQVAYHGNSNVAVGGLSAGGFGAMSYAARNPGLFTYAASYSGAVAITLPPNRIGTILLQGLTDPNPFARLGVPYIDEKNWAAHDPFALADKLRGTGLYLSSGLTGFAAPYDDIAWSIPAQIGEVSTGQQTSALAAKLQLLGIPATVHLYMNGYHDWQSWSRELVASWPLMMKAIGATSV